MSPTHASVLLLSSVLFVPAIDAQPDPEELVSKIVAAYAELSTYQDTGFVERTNQSGSDDPNGTLSFSIAFKRTGRFRIERSNGPVYGLVDQADHRVLSSDGREVHLYREPSREYRRWQYSDGMWLIVGLDPFSFVPSDAALLLDMSKPSGAAPLSRLTGMELHEEEQFDGVQCYVLTGAVAESAELSSQRPLVMKSKYKYWIGRDDFLIRRSERTMSFSHESPPSVRSKWGAAEDAWLRNGPTTMVFRTTTRVVHRNIRVNDEIADEVFRFVPPEGARRVTKFSEDR